jgi:hypothetical protein
VVIVSVDGNGSLSNNDRVIMANFSHNESGETTEDTQKHYRVREINLEGLLRENRPKYEFATVIRVTK